MKALLSRWPLMLPLFPIVAIVACADSSDESPPDVDGGGTPETSVPEQDASTDAADAGDAAALRCSGDFCLADLPNAAAYGFVQWRFVSIVSDPATGLWAAANGRGDEAATVQLLHFEDDAWKPKHGPTLGEGADRRSVFLTSFSGDGAGHFLGVGYTVGEGTSVIVRGDGTTFTTTTFDEGARPFASWFEAPGEAWVAGELGAIFHSLPDGQWRNESLPVEEDAGTAPASLYSIWGSGPDDVYFGGVFGEGSGAAYLAHRVRSDAGVAWTDRAFYELQTRPWEFHAINAGIALRGGPRFWASNDMLATAEEGAGAEWTRSSFMPPVPVRAFWAAGKADVWAVADVGRVYHFDGTTWKDAELVFNGAPLTAHLTGVVGTSSGELFIVGDNVALRKRAR